MKKALSALLCLVWIYSLALPARASSLLTGLDRKELHQCTYVDQDTGNTISLPSGWSVEIITGDPVAKAEFTSDKDDDAVIQYGSVDMWNAQSTSMKEKISREEFDNEMYSHEDIAKLVGTDKKYVATVKRNGEEYFRAEIGKKRLFSFKVTEIYFVCVKNGWMYVYAFEGNEKHDLYSDFEELLSSASYGQFSETNEVPAETTIPVTKPAEAAPSESDIYADAVKAYEDGSYYKAEDLFTSVSGYQDSNKYLRLIRIRNAGSNIGAGSKVYNSSCGLTSSDMRDIDAAARDFYFADTAEVLLCNTDVACYYLIGEWNGGSKCYIHFIDNGYGARYNIGSKLSTNYQDTFSIIDGEIRVDVTNTNKLTLRLTLTAPDCMEVYTYEKNGNCYTLNRK